MHIDPQVLYEGSVTALGVSVRFWVVRAGHVVIDL